MTGYLCQPVQPIDWLRSLGLIVSLMLTISGSTVMNMIIDRDIDAKMSRTRQRPLATGQVGIQAAFTLGITLIIAGLLWSLWLSPLYFAVVLAGAAINVLVYSLWLKRRTAWSILFGGMAGGMPILAGRVLAVGQVDTLGILLALIVICWIPGHNLTLDMLYADDYVDAGIPTAVNVYGQSMSYGIITLFTSLVATLVLVTSFQLDISGIPLALILSGSIGSIIFSIYAWITRTENTNLGLYKFASFYLLVLMAILIFTGIF